MKNQQLKILLVEDDDSLREGLTTVLGEDQFLVMAKDSAEKALSYNDLLAVDCVLSDFKLPGMNGIEFLEQFRNRTTDIPFVIMTAFGSVEAAVQAMKFGATDFLTKPIQPEAIGQFLHEIITHKRIISRSEKSQSGKLLTENKRTQLIIEQIEKVAAVDTSILLLGESGTGKELAARSIHNLSSRNTEPFVAVNCGAIPKDLLESEFFGHAAGAFTGATQQRIGILEFASTGTVFLDEVSEMPVSLQVKLLRALQEKEIQPVGSNRSIKIRPRIIAATNHDITEDLASGKLRDDFYYRIAVVSLELPPLRERREDIDLLTNHFLKHYAKKNNKPVPSLNTEAKKLLQTHSWPGNIRELEHVIERAVCLADDVINVDHLGIVPEIDFDSLLNSSRTLHDITREAVERAERNAIERALRETGGNKTGAARLLGVSYKTLLNKTREYEIEIPN